MNKYYEWDDFNNIYLEDSFVLNIEESEEQISFVVEMVLKESHSMYSLPHNGEKYCYKLGKILFDGLKSVRWINRETKSFLDDVGDRDFGNIDFFELSPEGYHLFGDWGEIIINSSPPKIVWVE